MRHRMGIAAMTHIGGNNDPVILNNEGKLSKEQKKMMREAIKLWKSLKYGVDFQFFTYGIGFGREPAYQYEDLLIISLNVVKEDSYIQTGEAFGVWGSGIRSRTKIYRDYKRKSKFIRFVDKWYSVIYQRFKKEVKNNGTK